MSGDLIRATDAEEAAQGDAAAARAGVGLHGRPHDEVDVAVVGGKNASLGEMISGLASSGVQVPGGFATTADAYREFVAAGARVILNPSVISNLSPSNFSILRVVCCGIHWVTNIGK